MDLKEEIEQAYLCLVKAYGQTQKKNRSDLIAYQIGWGTLLIGWYESGLRGETPQMPGDGFSSWKYKEIAQHFYRKHQYDSGAEQLRVFDLVVRKILAIVSMESENGNLDRMGVWPWCTLRSGKQWPLSKWVRVNTVSPYKAAAKTLI